MSVALALGTLVATVYGSVMALLAGGVERLLLEVGLLEVRDE